MYCYEVSDSEEMISKVPVLESVLFRGVDQDQCSVIFFVKCFFESMLTIVQERRMVALLGVPIGRSGEPIGKATSFSIASEMSAEDFFEGAAASDAIPAHLKAVLAGLRLRACKLAELDSPGITAYVFPLDTAEREALLGGVDPEQAERSLLFADFCMKNNPNSFRSEPWSLLLRL